MTRVQICGVTSLDDAITCERIGTDAIGFVNVEGRRRSLSLEEIRDIIASLGPLVSSSLIAFPKNADEIIRNASYVNADIVQIYTLNVSKIEKIREQGFKVVRSVSVDIDNGIEFSIEELKDFSHVCDVILFEPSKHGKTGGIGLEYDYKKLLSPYLNYCKRFNIAGGLTPGNVNKALLLKPYAVHVSSGVESIFGIKDQRKVEEFIRRCNR